MTNTTEENRRAADYTIVRHEFNPGDNGNSFFRCRRMASNMPFNRSAGSEARMIPPIVGKNNN
jgi:hypothetical protein